MEEQLFYAYCIVKEDEAVYVDREQFIGFMKMHIGRVIIVFHHDILSHRLYLNYKKTL